MLISIWLNVITDQGIPYRIPSFEGQALVDVLEDYHIPQIDGKCKKAYIFNELYEHPYDYMSLGPVCNCCRVELSGSEQIESIPKGIKETRTLLESESPMNNLYDLI